MSDGAEQLGCGRFRGRDFPSTQLRQKCLRWGRGGGRGGRGGSCRLVGSRASRRRAPSFPRRGTARSWGHRPTASPVTPRVPSPGGRGEGGTGFSQVLAISGTFSCLGSHRWPAATGGGERCPDATHSPVLSACCLPSSVLCTTGMSIIALSPNWDRLSDQGN